MNIIRPSSLITALTASVLLAVAAPRTKAEPVSGKPAQQCVSDLKAFDARLQSDGYWIYGSGYGYGYPMYGYEFGNHYVADPALTATGYSRVRPGYEVRTLIASANILSQHGEAQACESALRSATAIYTTYAAELRKGNVAHIDVSAWRQQQIAAAVAVAGSDIAFRSDQLVGAGVVNPQGEDLGSVDDIVLDPQAGKIAYLVISRGGIFGIDEKYVPVPWDSFKIASGNKLLVLASTKATMDGAPHVKENENLQKAEFTAVSLKVNAYWLAHLPT